eukprot:TRINITY_DN5477_c0_g1_i1.p1 TRINITY_DN5477_c0_g1~~TRINITY_DN5477_c0_g1_i1.p1  ORF type:complete len:300 (-),score=54.70 TRINITY_DN5477_c0_g1_i1:74-973(-)
MSLSPRLLKTATASFSASERIGLIGIGQMGGSLLKGLVAAKIPTQNILVSDAHKITLLKAQDQYGIQPCSSNRELVQKCKIIITAVKPNIIDSVLQDISPDIRASHVIISIAAGVTLASVEKQLPEHAKVVRVMPNMAASCNHASSSVTFGKWKSNPIWKSDVDLVFQLLGSVGRCFEVSESLIDAVIGVAGSGSAYVFMMIEAMTQGGVRAGLSQPLSLEMAAQTVLGAAKLVLESKIHPAQLRDSVCSPGGTTIEGVITLENDKFRSAVLNCIGNVVQRSKEMRIAREAAEKIRSKL